MKGPGGILLIGVAVFLIAAGITGRLDALADAIRGKSGRDTDGDTGNGDLPDEEPPEESPKCPETNWTVVMSTGTSKDKTFCCPQSGAVGSVPDNGTCPTGYDKGFANTANGQKELCVQVDKCNPFPGGKAGFGIRRGYNLALLPTGFTSWRYAPNV